MKKEPIALEGSAITHVATGEDEGLRLDTFLAQQCSGYSRSKLQTLIAAQLVTINGLIADKASTRIAEGDQVMVTFLHAPLQDNLVASAPPIPVLYRHEHFLVIDKPAGIAVHHSARARGDDPTLIDWIRQHMAEIQHVGCFDRPGIVHRLDRQTSGLMIIARTTHAHVAFTRLFKERAITKTYLAIAQGHVPASTPDINLSILRDPHHRHRMMAITPNSLRAKAGRDAATRLHIREYCGSTTLLELTPLTGRTHQIRVHLAAIGHPLLGDAIYGEKSPLISRHALHAHRLSFSLDEQQFSFEAPLPNDFQAALHALRTQ